MSNLLRNIPKKRLFMVCPTDGMELHISKKFKGEAFFCTALGSYFEFDFQTQWDLWELIVENKIEQVILISSINNVFYKKTFDKHLLSACPVYKELAQVKSENSNNFNDQKVFFSSVHSLVASHMTNQKIRLLDTEYLGNRLIEAKINVDAYAYHPRKEVYYTLKEIKKRAQLLNKLSYN